MLNIGFILRCSRLVHTSSLQFLSCKDHTSYYCFCMFLLSIESICHLFLHLFPSPADGPLGMLGFPGSSLGARNTRQTSSSRIVQEVPTGCAAAPCSGPRRPRSKKVGFCGEGPPKTEKSNSWAIAVSLQKSSNDFHLEHPMIVSHNL